MHSRKLSQNPSLPVDVGMWQVIEGTSLSYSRAGYSQCLPTNELNHLSCSCLMGKLIVWTKRRVACGKYESKNPMIKEHASATATTNSHENRKHTVSIGDVGVLLAPHDRVTICVPGDLLPLPNLPRASQPRPKLKSVHIPGFPQSNRNQTDHHSSSQCELNLSGRKRTVTVTFSLGAGSSSNPANSGDAGPSSKSTGVRRDEDVVVVVVDVGETDCGCC